MIISISGKIGVGKDEVARIILEATSYKFIVRRFADSLKDMVCILLGCTREQLEDREFKETELGEEWRIYKHANKIYKSYEEAYSQLVFYYWWDLGDMTHEKLAEKLITSYIPTPRLLLQLLGTECGRQILHPNVWVNSLMSEYKLKWVSTGDSVAEEDVSIQKEYPNWIIPDTRFPNELRAVKDRAGITIRVNRPDFVENSLTGEKFLVKVHKSEHLSETSLDHAEFDYVIENDGTLKDLKEKVIEILKEEKIL